MLVLQQLLNGLSFGALLFLLASGFTLVFGLMRIANLAHGAFYLLGGYVGVVVTAGTGNLALGLLAGAITVAILATGVERVLLRRVRGNELAEVLLTIGIAFIVADICLAIFGGNPMTLSVSEWLKGGISLGVMPYPKYRLFIIGFTVLVGIALYIFQKRSRLGAMIRAGVDDREMAAACGINVDRIISGVFVLGGALAGIAGVIGAGLLSLRPGADVDILLFALVVVIIGGLGSINGAAVGSVLIGVIDATSRVWFPEFSYFTIFAPMALVLVLRPTGLFGRKV
ncbi:MAG TPA: branched-chain amino acid ABC transporter permease [Acidimicrobiia bacterium]|nr:branched-chain amino acid ABC transporter permease [Acidimicrobiia bacterium]